ncbi:uncharacterized protein LOC141601155 [Silene latifolia]|uniref:uncharacterized protein LOC141601155 n=1 Tax=Silene latifolia TaxID=37657 RepID=UPI003D77151B
MAALNRFISRFSERCMAFYDMLRKNKQFHWTPEHEEAFQDLKLYLSSPPLLAKPEKGEPLSVYLSVTNLAVSAVLVKEQEALTMSFAKLCPYFERHPIIVMTNLPINYVLLNPELSSRMAKCPNLESDLAKEVNQIENRTSDQEWTLFTDGATNMRGTRLGLVLKSQQEDIIAQAVSCEFKATNNETEYEALIAGLKFHSFDIEQIPRDLNTQADALASLGSNFTPAIFDKVPIVHLLGPVISRPEQVNPVNTDNNSWSKPYYDWFLRG